MVVGSGVISPASVAVRLPLRWGTRDSGVIWVSGLVTISPRKGAMRGLVPGSRGATSVRKRPISTSGFWPGWMTAEELEDHVLVVEDVGVGLLGGAEVARGERRGSAGFGEGGRGVAGRAVSFS